VRFGWALLVFASIGCGPGMGSIGAMLTKNHTDGRVTVRQVPRDMESAQAGLEPGDEILFIDGRDAKAMTAEQVHQELVGPVGTTVNLTILRGETVRRLTIRRGTLK
jgi:C-terminal processing protease CtpA/Prc